MFKGGGKLVIGEHVIESDSHDEPKYATEEIQKLKKLIASDAYANLPKDATSYQRLAMIREHLKYPLNEVGYAWLQASWQVEDNASIRSFAQTDEVES